jgi:hypothetical protein
MHVVLRLESSGRALQGPPCILGSSDEHFPQIMEERNLQVSCRMRQEKDDVWQRSKDQALHFCYINPSFHHIISYATRDPRSNKSQGRSFPPLRPMPGCMFVTSPTNYSITHAKYANFSEQTLLSCHREAHIQLPQQSQGGTERDIEFT